VSETRGGSEAERVAYLGKQLRSLQMPQTSCACDRTGRQGPNRRRREGEESNRARHINSQAEENKSDSEQHKAGVCTAQGRARVTCSLVGSRKKMERASDSSASQWLSRLHKIVHEHHQASAFGGTAWTKQSRVNHEQAHIRRGCMRVNERAT
jgi:hypothetical protein